MIDRYEMVLESHNKKKRVLYFNNEKQLFEKELEAIDDNNVKIIWMHDNKEKCVIKNWHGLKQGV